ncbi:hypothetical protein [Chryseobacterium luquanense]|uniref:Uncharacterized protein n=1 Tax=Chryseobacterium luquanense TaxID=2983766 RepID=A0ABT3Y4E9_9FLAO|nr:hypothetical protein [Chryseobacterium luquanense]MCX8532969.1 hypothetical protein [Chryseobacterium luquanense]
MSKTPVTTIFQTAPLFCRVKILFVLLFLQAFYTIYGQMSLQGSVVIIDEELHNKRIDYLSVTSGTYIYNITENRNKKESKTILAIAKKPKKNQSSKKTTVKKREHPKASQLRYYTGSSSEVFFNVQISKGFVCTGNNYHIKKDATLTKLELSEVFHFSKDFKLALAYHLKTHYDYSKKHKIRPPPSSFI